MTTPFPFVANTILTAAQLNAVTTLPIAAKTANYVLAVGDVGYRVQMTAAGSTTITVNTGIFSAGDTIWIQNMGAGTCTITAGTATVSTASSLALAQYGGGTLVFQSASAATFFSQQAATYGAATGGTGFVAGPTGYVYTSFTTDANLTVTRSGLFDVMLIAGGGGGGNRDAVGTVNSGGGGAGGVAVATVYLAAGTYAVDVGAGGAAQLPGLASTLGSVTVGSTVAPTAVGGGAGGGFNPSVYVTTFTGGSAGALRQDQGASSAKILGQGNSSGAGQGTLGDGNGAGGGGGAGAAGSAGTGAAGGAGGAGLEVNTFIGGASLFKAAGGGGQRVSGSGGAGGSSIGGAGASSAATGGTAAANTGSGGGGGDGGGAGGSGIVYVRTKS